VTSRSLGDARFFIKPRTIFWEMLFFGRNSPLKVPFSGTTIEFNLEQKYSRGPRESEVWAVDTSGVPASMLDSFFSFGQLLAYCYFFGLQDMHKDNILRTSTGLQAIDVEQAFSDLLLPNQTLMLTPNKDINWSSALNLVTSRSVGHLERREAKALIDGFVALAGHLKKNLPTVIEIIASLNDDFRNQPIRVFFRGTREYTDAVSGGSQIVDALEEEMIQLARGDVPYFFTFLGRNKIYYYTTADWNYAEVRVPESFRKFVENCGCDPLVLLSAPSIEKRFARGLLFLSRKMRLLTNADLKWEGCGIERASEQLVFRSPDLKAVSRI